MIDKIFSWRARNVGGWNDADRSAGQADGTIAASQLRAIAAEAGLVASVDGSLGGLVNLWTHDERLHPPFGHHPPCRRAN
jgi:hypothetical protein